MHISVIARLGTSERAHVATQGQLRTNRLNFDLERTWVVRANFKWISRYRFELDGAFAAIERVFAVCSRHAVLEET